jgi:hypothetical protein
MLLGGVLLLVFAFQTSSRLAHAYGIAVTTTMVVDGLIGFIVVWKLWKWQWWSAALCSCRWSRSTRVPQREPAEAVRRRMAAGGVRRLHGAADHDLAARLAHPGAQDASASKCRSTR